MESGEQASFVTKRNEDLQPKTTESKPQSIPQDYGKPISFGSGYGSYGRAGGSAVTAKPEVTMSPAASVEMLKAFQRAAASEKSAPQAESVGTKDNTTTAEQYKIIGEAFDCYVLVEQENSLLLIDKHAAHERVLFEQLKEKYESDGRVASQALLLPISVQLGADELAAVMEAKNDFSAVGFEFIKNGYLVDITAIPDAITAEGAELFFTEMADELLRGAGNPAVTEAIRRERALYQIACKAAIKGGRKYTAELIEWLISKILSMPDLTVCPHGRPVAYKLSKRELDRQFDRIK